MSFVKSLLERWFRSAETGYFVTLRYRYKSTDTLRIEKMYNGHRETVYELINKNNEISVLRPGITVGGAQDYTGVWADAYEGQIPYSLLSVYFNNSQEVPYAIDGSGLETALKEFPLKRIKAEIALPDGTFIDAQAARQIADAFKDA